jgi:hypothetical protein
MSRMVRKQIYLQPEQDALLKQGADELGISAADLIRRCLNDMRRHGGKPLVDWRAWRDELGFLQARAVSHKAKSQSRTRTREGL